MISRILSEGDRMLLRKFIGNGGDDDNGDNNSGAISVRSKVETGGSSQVQGSSEVKKNGSFFSPVLLTTWSLNLGYFMFVYRQAL